MLSIAAHYDQRKDRFMIATGVINDDAEMAVALWCAEDSGEFVLLAMYTLSETLPIEVGKKSTIWLTLPRRVSDSDCFIVRTRRTQAKRRC